MKSNKIFMDSIYRRKCFSPAKIMLDLKSELSSFAFKAMFILS